MEFFRKMRAGPVQPAALAPAGRATTKQAGDAAEDLALQHLHTAGLQLLERNYRTPGRGGGEIDLIMRAPDGTVVCLVPPPAWAPPSSGASCLLHGTTCCA